MRHVHVISIALLTTLSGFALGVGCSDDPVDGASTAGAGASTGSNSGGAGGLGSGGAGGLLGSGGFPGSGGAMTTGTFTSGVGGAPTVESPCQADKVYECGDIIDNDRDGLSDYQDPDCLGACDNTEGSYYGGIPGQAGPACTVDCYFDQDSGSGNDKCYWNHQCDPHEVAPGYHPESNNGASCAYNLNANTPGTSGSCADLYQTQSQACRDYCLPLTPNGCDCFGCCELPAGGGNYVWLGSDADGTGDGSCTRNDINDPTKCEPCQPVAGCLNECGPCELCIDKETLPPECYQQGSGGGGVGGGGVGSGGAGNGGPIGQCPATVQPCGLQGQDPCPTNFYCITGCCQEVPQ